MIFQKYQRLSALLHVKARPLEKDGSFVNAMGETQSFNAAIESDVLSEIEVIEKLNG